MKRQFHGRLPFMAGRGGQIRFDQSVRLQPELHHALGDLALVVGLLAGTFFGLAFPSPESAAEVSDALRRVVQGFNGQ